MTRTITHQIDGEAREITIDPPGGFDLMYLIAEVPESDVLRVETVVWAEDVIYSCTDLEEDEIESLTINDVKYILNESTEEMVKKAKESDIESKMDNNGFVNLDDMR